MVIVLCGEYQPVVEDLHMSETSGVTLTPSGGMEVGNDNPNTLISTVRFDGNNFIPWFHSA